MPELLKVGELVLHRAGGPILTIASIEGDDVTVTWTTPSGEPRTRTFKADTLLRPIAPGPPRS